MAGIRFTKRAEVDLQEIADYTRRAWGGEQCLGYLDELEECCRRLADSPDLGRACDDLRSGYCRIEQGRHVIFFRKVEDGGVLVVRILHARMLPERHLSEDDETTDDPENG